MPSVLLHPFSMLEVMAQRELLSFHLLFDLDKEDDPLQRYAASLHNSSLNFFSSRFFIVLRWFISLVRTETIEKKPYNPVIGEYHHAWVINDGMRTIRPRLGPLLTVLADTDDVTEFISEQVSHHPPISATYTRAAKHGLELQLNPTFGCHLTFCFNHNFISFGVKFGRNFAGVTTAGAAKLVTPKDTYELSKVPPSQLA